MPNSSRWRQVGLPTSGRGVFDVLAAADNAGADRTKASTVSERFVAERFDATIVHMLRDRCRKRANGSFDFDSVIGPPEIDLRDR